MKPGPRFAAAFRWLNAHLGWWSFAIFVLVAGFAVLGLSGTLSSGYPDCDTTSRQYDADECRDGMRFMAWVDVSIIASAAATPVLLVFCIQFLRNHLTLRRDRQDMAPRWEAVKDQYSRGAYGSLDEMKAMQEIRNGSHLPTHQWLAGRSALAVGVTAAITAALFVAAAGWIAYDSFCEENEDEQACQSYYTLWKVAAGLGVPVLVGAIIVAILGAGLRVTGARMRAKTMRDLDQKERAALDKLRGKP